jgi:hypothetical protein
MSSELAPNSQPIHQPEQEYNRFSYKPVLLLPETQAILKLPINETETIKDGTKKILRWCPDALIEALRNEGYNDEEIIQLHHRLMGRDSRLDGHTSIIAQAGRRLNLSYDEQIAFEIHDLPEAFLCNEGRISDYISGQKPDFAKFQESDSLMWMLDEVGIKGRRAAEIFKIIQKEGPEGELLKQAEKKQFNLHSRYMTNTANYLEQIPNPETEIQLYIKTMRGLSQQVKDCRHVVTF